MRGKSGVCGRLCCFGSFALLHLGDNARIDLIELVEDQQNADAAPSDDVANDVDGDEHLGDCAALMVAVPAKPTRLIRAPKIALVMPEPNSGRRW